MAFNTAVSQNNMNTNDTRINNPFIMLPSIGSILANNHRPR